jgi:hypothetical protein
MAADAASSALQPARSAFALLLFGMIAAASAQDAAEQNLEEVQTEAAQAQPPTEQPQERETQPEAREQTQPDPSQMPPPQAEGHSPPQTETQNQAQPEGAPSSGVTPAESPPEPSEPSAMEVCAQTQRPDESMLERVRRNLTLTACASSAWLDSLFGDQIRYDEYRATNGSVSAGALWSRYDGFDPRLRFRVRLQLPQWNEGLAAFAGRVGEENFISDTESDFEALPTRQFGTLEDDSILLGLGYSNPHRTGNDFDVGVGVRLDLPLDPYVRARYEVVRAFADHYVFNAREAVFWQNSEGFGTTTRINIDRAINERLLLRWGNVGKYTEETNGLEWYSQLTLFQRVNDRMGFAWQGQIEGQTDNSVPLTRYAARLIVRRQMTPEWLFLELRAGVGWPRFKLDEARVASPELGVAFEMQFGKRN